MFRGNLGKKALYYCGNGTSGQEDNGLWQPLKVHAWEQILFLLVLGSRTLLKPQEVLILSKTTETIVK